MKKNHPAINLLNAYSRSVDINSDNIDAMGRYRTEHGPNVNASSFTMARMAARGLGHEDIAYAFSITPEAVQDAIAFTGVYRNQRPEHYNHLMGPARYNGEPDISDYDESEDLLNL